MKDKIKELESQLGPCPFCGGKMRIVKSEVDYDFECDTENCILEEGMCFALSEDELPEYIEKFNQRGAKMPLEMTILGIIAERQNE